MKRNVLILLIAFTLAGGARHTVHAQAKLLIHYWHFNNTLPLSGAGGINLNAIPPDYTTNPGASVNYVKMPGVVADTGLMDNNNGGGTLNLRNGAVAGNYVRMRNESDSMWVTWYFNTKFYKNIVLKYETETSSTNSGQTTQLFDYSLDSGVTWQTTGLPIASYNATAVFTLVTLDLSAINGANHSNKFVFRIRFNGNTGNGLGIAAKGNNRFDNISLEGDTLIFAPPTAPVASSPSHIAGVWSKSTNVQASWTPSTTGSSKIAGYSYVWDQLPSTVPAAVVGTTGLTASNSFGSGQWYFHVRGVDTNGAGSITSHFGPIQIDTTAPLKPVVTTSTPKLGTWTNNPAIAVSVAATDAHSGVGYFKWKWDASPTATTFTDSGAISTINVIAPSEGTTAMLHVAAVDNLGNVSPTYDIGPFMLDFTPPHTPAFTGMTPSPRTWTSGNTVTLKWSAVDYLSGIGAYSVLWDTIPVNSPNVVYYQVSGTTLTSPQLAAGRSWYAHLRVFDNALNPSTVIHAGPFYLDPSAPHAPSVSHASFDPGAWTSAPSDTIAWTIATSDTARLHDFLGYSWSWTNSPNSNPDTTVTNASNVVVSSLGDGSWYFHLRAVDSARNWSGTVHYGPLNIDRTAPTATIRVDQSSEPTDPTIVNLAITAIDAGCGLKGMQLSNDGVSWTALMPFTNTISNWDLSAYGGTEDPGVKTVYLHVFDNIGNATHLTANVEIKKKPPVITTGVSDVSAQPETAELTVFPNPASSQFTVTLRSSATEKLALSEVKIFDALGREVMGCSSAEASQHNQTVVSVDATALPAGVYAIRWGVSRPVLLNLVK